MFLTTVLLTTMVDAYAPDATIHCTFPGQGASQRPIEIVLDPRPSLKDRPGLWRVMMEMNGKMSLRGAAQPIKATAERDILIRGITTRKSTYVIGLRDDGSAALRMDTRAKGANESRRTSRAGKCHGHENHIDRWLPS